MSIDKTMASGPSKKSGLIPESLRVSLLDKAGRPMPIRKTPVSLGRKNAEIIIPDATVSTLHAVIEMVNNGFVIVDQGSTNGTFVNGERVAASAIANLDEVKLGDVAYTFSVVEDRYGMHEEQPAESNQTLLIASSPTVAPLPETMVAMLHCESGGQDTTVRLTRRITTVGRSEGDVNVGDQTLSRKHFQVEIHPDHVAVKDLGSVNGTHVAGKPISYHRLVQGQEFSAGRTRFRVEIKAG